MLEAERTAIVAELEQLRKNIEHIKDIVAMQQSYARTSGMIERVAVTELVDDALRMNCDALARHEVALVREYQARAVIPTDKHKVVQILINLVRNAQHACDESGRTDKRIIVRVTEEPPVVRIAVTDNGVGIPAANLVRIFSHGFTTRKHGHGFGLHSSALAAKQLGGSLMVQSDGPGRGATFTLELPLNSEPSLP
jgi:signal transduction histidine kinase